MRLFRGGDGQLRRLDVLFFLEVGSRRVSLGGVSANPNGACVTHQARNLLVARDAKPPHLVIRDRDAKFTDSFDEVFASEGAEIIRTPVRAPAGNAYAERWVGTVRHECLDWLLIAAAPGTGPAAARRIRRCRCESDHPWRRTTSGCPCGLIHEYEHAA